MTAKNSIIINLCDLDVLDILSDKECGELLRCIKAYLDKEEYTPSLLAKLAFIPLKSALIINDIKSRRREHHWNWKGGLTDENHALRSSAEYKHWRADVFERDKYTCMECGHIGGILNAHHVKPWATHQDLRFNVDNGLTLCQECHKEAHRG